MKKTENDFLRNRKTIFFKIGIKSWKNQKRFSYKSENDFLQNRDKIAKKSKNDFLQNRKTIFFKIGKRFSSKSENDFLQNQKTIFCKIRNTKVGHILHKSMTHSLDIQYMCWLTQHCKFKHLYYTEYWSSKLFRYYFWFHVLVIPMK